RAVRPGDLRSQDAAHGRHVVLPRRVRRGADVVDARDLRHRRRRRYGRRGVSRRERVPLAGQAVSPRGSAPRGARRTVVEMWRRIRALAVVLLVLAMATGAAIPAVRRAALQRVGGVLVAGDQPGASDLLTMDVESGLAGVLKVADLYRERPAPGGLMIVRPTAIDNVLRERGVKLPRVLHDVLSQLGVPPDAIVEIP